MKLLYKIAGISRQGHYKSYQKALKSEDLNKQILDQVRQIRVDHPRMGMATLYDKLHPEGIGRDRFIELLKINGLQLNKVKNYKRTTYSKPHLAYPNLIKGLLLKTMNELWVSDITYYKSGSLHYYLVFIMDVYSRRIVGHAASDSLAAQLNMRALKRALALRSGQNLEGLIHHSDRGSQYIYHKYIQLLKRYKIKISMGNKAWENAHAERINRTIKNDYLYPKGQVKNLKSLQKKLTHQVYLYNQQRPHQELPGKLSPVAFGIASSNCAI